MASIYKKFKTNEKLENEGVTVDYGDAGKFRIARAGGSNKAHSKALEAVNRKYRNQFRLEIVEEDESRKILAEVYANTVILGWEDVYDEDGKAIPFTPANCIKLLLDLPDLFADIREMASTAALFREHLAEHDSKN